MHIKQKSFAMLLILMIILNTGYVIFQNKYAAVTVLIFGIVFIYMFAFKKFIVYDFKLTVVVFFIGMILFEIIINKDFNFSHYLGLIMVIVSSFVVSASVSLEDFCKYYNKIIFWLALVSIPFFLLGYFFPHIVEGFPTINYLLNNGATGYKNGFLYLYRYDPRLDFQTGFIKNNSIFWEPGAYQGILNLAIIFEIKSKNPDKFKIIVYTICLITTFSTTGILCGILILLSTLALRNNRNKFNIKISTILIILIVVTVFLSINSNIIFGKLSAGSDSHESFLERYSGSITDLYMFINSNLLGVGYTNFGLQSNGSSNGITSTFAQYGLIFGSSILMGLVFFIRKITREPFEIITYIAVFIIMLSTEAFMIKHLFFLMMFYGYGIYDYKMRKKCKEEEYA